MSYSQGGKLFILRSIPWSLPLTKTSDSTGQSILLCKYISHWIKTALRKDFAEIAAQTLLRSQEPIRNPSPQSGLNISTLKFL